VRGLAENLDILSKVVRQANQSLLEQGAFRSSPRWDPASLVQITGDFERTLKECHDLLETNERYAMSSGPIGNIEWNILLQPNVTRLRQRIVLHNSKILTFLKPFEM
jgi:hypothetical protein